MKGPNICIIIPMNTGSIAYPKDPTTANVAVFVGDKKYPKDTGVVINRGYIADADNPNMIDPTYTVVFSAPDIIVNMHNVSTTKQA